jgi:outer membrane cobalamin receptor
VGLLATPPASAATIAGRVLDPDGRPMAAVTIVVSTPNGTLASRETGPDGRFEIADVPIGNYEVGAAAEGLAADRVRVAVPTGDSRPLLDLRLHVSAISETVVVSASHVDVPLSRAGDTVTVLTSAELEARQIGTVEDALRLVPGLTVARSGDRGALTSLFPRGGGSNYTLVLVDGIKANAFGGGFDFGHLTAADIDRIEIVRGPQSALFGSDAVGAVVQIVTRRGGRPRADALVEGGNQGTVRARAGAAGSARGWGWGAGFEQTRSDGFTGLAPATGERVSNDDDRLTHGSASIGWQRADGSDFLLAGNLQRDERGFPGPFGSNPVGAFTCVDRVSRGINDSRQLGSRFVHPWSSRARERLEVNYTNVAGHFTSPALLPPAYSPCDFGDPPAHSSSGTARFDFRVQEDLAVSTAVALTAGVELERERGSSSYITDAAGAAIDVLRSLAAPFAELRYVGGERFFLTAGLRVDRLTRDALPADAFGSRPVFPAQTIDSVNPKVALTYLTTPPDHRTGTRVHASAGTGIRPPDAFEIAFTDNPHLKPERSRSFDAGIEQRIAGGAYIIGATAFVNRYDDLLVTVGRALKSASLYKTDNLSNARASGLELSVDARPRRSLTLRANYTWLRTHVLSVDGLPGTAQPPFMVGQPLIRRPSHAGEADAVYAAGRLTVFGELTTRSHVLDIEPTAGALFGGLFDSSGLAVVNLGGSVRIGRGAAVFARVLNAADRQYEEVFGFPALRRSGVVGIRVAAGR